MPTEPHGYACDGNAWSTWQSPPPHLGLGQRRGMRETRLEHDPAEEPESGACREGTGHARAEDKGLLAPAGLDGGEGRGRAQGSRDPQETAER